MSEKTPTLWGPLVVILLLLAHLLEAEDELTTVADTLDYNSCQGRCVEAYFPGYPCYCNSNCQQYENCCEDYYAECKPEYVWSDEWSEFEGHAYKFFSDLQITSPVAREACRGHGGLLVSINSAEEQVFIGDSVLKQRVLSAFIGGSDSNVEGQWMWADGTRMPNPTDSLYLWYSGQPDDGGVGEDCALITNYKFWVQRKITLNTYEWIDYNCATNNREIQGYICERTLACEPNPCQNGGSCYYIGAAEEFRCECTPGFFGLQCEIQLKDGETWSQCGETVLTGSSGVVTSPLYPREYPPNVRCQWAINVGEGKTISLSIEMMDLESSKDCFFDSLTITDGNYSDAGSRLIGPACGDLSTSNQTSLILPVTTSGPAALIDFRTDATESGRGFRLTYKADRCGRGAGDSGCGVPQMFETDCGRTEFSQGPAEGAPCQWDIQVPVGKLINLTFTEFHIQDTGVGCSSGGLVVYDGAIEPASVVGRACGRRFPWSVVSTSNRLYLRLQGTIWDNDIHKVAFQYTSFNVTSWRVASSPHIIDIRQGASGSMSASTSPVNVETEDTNIRTWLVRCQVGDRLQFNWTLYSSMAALVQIYDGYSVYSHLVTSEVSSSTTLSGEVTATTFQLLVKVTSNRTDESLQFDATYRAEEWTPTLSGCYRPLFSSQTDSLSTENSVVLPDQPVVVMVSESANHATHPGYDPGLYCKWTVRGEQGKRIRLQLLDFNTPPNLPDCDSDGLVVYDPFEKTVKGKLCGASSAILENTFVSSSEVLDIYFYSDTRGIRRRRGNLRAIITTEDNSSCEFHQMESSYNPTLSTSCGLLLSPYFPGMVPPGQWTWTLEVPGNDYFVVNVHYVRGPALVRPVCDQYFQMREVPIDSTTLKQYESNLMYLCEDTDVFIPEHSIKNPPGQKLAIELQTITSATYQRWEFKISYSSSEMEKPLYTEGPPGACPQDYSYYRGNCYMYEEWVKRHYKPELYKYQTTWQASYDRCRSDDATLLTIKDKEEADFIKYKLTHRPWFWDTAAPIQLNHRLIYLGLSNQQGEYIWNDGVQLAYSDWFQPVEPWEQPILHTDEQDKYELLGLTLPEPKPDFGSVCTALLVRSPFGSLNWAKMPCDYPLFKAGLICKKPARDNSTMEQVTPLNDTTLRQQQTSGYLGCEPGWRLLGDICFRMDTDYEKVVASKVSQETNSQPPKGMTYAEAEAMCTRVGAHVGLSGPKDLRTIRVFLDIWRHALYMGDIWMDGDGDRCSVIQVSKNHRLSDEVQYHLLEGNCEDLVTTARPYNVMCSTDPIRLKEVCMEEEFQCGNGVCISIDFVCDGHNDCFDNTDEAECPGTNECGMETFHCGDGQCISMSFYCDFTDNCVDGSDEKYCVRETCLPNEFRCGSGECKAYNSTCNFVRDCKDGSDESDVTCDGSCRGFQCFSGLCLPNSMQHDVISDCPGVALEDEIYMSRDLLTIWDELTSSNEKENSTYLGCKEPDEAQCMPGYNKCFKRADTCVYDTVIADEGRETRIQATCREGSHLRTSCSEIECPGMFRCPSAYCVPYSKVCDGRKDCPEAEDEAGCEDYTCPGLFHCKMESFCLPHVKVCDGHTDCPVYGEDEKYCGLTDILCQDVCQCKGNIASCSNITSLPVPRDTRTRTLRSIIISNSKLEISNETFISLHWLGKLGLSANGIRRIPPYAFKDLTNLFELDLSGNKLSYLDIEVFNGLVSLRVLNLDNNQLDSIDRNTFSRLSALQQIIITKNPLTDVTQDAFANVPTLGTLYSDAFKFCCIAKQVETCTPEPDEFSSCEDLMANYPLQVSIWVLGIFAFAGNIFVIIWRIKTERSKVSSFLIINLGCSDFLMGMYMLIIASVDSHYRGQYIVYAEKWMTSTLCQIAGILAMLSSEVSVFMLTIISADRLFVIFFPFKSKLRLSQARYLVFSTWATCFILSIIPALGIPYFGDSFFGSTGVCLPFQMNNEQRPGWEYSVFIFLVLNLMSFIFIAVAYVMIFIKVKKEAKRMGGAASQTTDDVSLAKKLMLIVATDLMCWVPIILIGFVGLGGVKIPAQVSAWIAVFVLPLNSAVNPILYTMSAIDCSGKKKKSQNSTMNTTASRVSETSVGGPATIKMKPNGNSATANTA